LAVAKEGVGIIGDWFARCRVVRRLFEAFLLVFSRGNDGLGSALAVKGDDIIDECVVLRMMTVHPSLIKIKATIKK
jgi:hypothetical protein